MIKLNEAQEMNQSLSNGYLMASGKLKCLGLYKYFPLN